MKCEYHRYKLQPQTFLNAKDSLNKFMQEGFLFKFFFEDLNAYGYSSLHLHPSLGDQTANDFEKDIKKNGIQDLDFLVHNAIIDAKGEALKLKTKMQSHHTALTMFLSHEELIKLNKEGVTRIKIKVIPEKISRKSFLEIFDFYQKDEAARHFDFIFDFNQTGFEHEILVALNSNSQFKYYLEDPIEFNFPGWHRLIENGGLLLADQINFQEIKDLKLAGLVVKPTKCDLKDILIKHPNFKILVTSNMGETLDILTSMYWASLMQSKYSERFFGAGFLTHEFYQINPYINQALIKEVYAEGFKQSSGWGYRSFLKNLKWESLT